MPVNITERRFYLKKSKISSVCVKGKSCNSPEVCNFIKNRFQYTAVFL